MDRATLDVFAVSLVLPIAAMLFALLSPDPPAAPFTRSFEELGRAYRGTYIGLTLAAVAPAAGVAFLVWRTFLAFTEAGGFVAAADTISLRPGALAWLLSATILAMACAWFPFMIVISRRVLGDRYPELAGAFWVNPYKLRTEQQLRLGAGAACLAAVGITLLGDWRFVATPTEIRFDPYFAFEERVYRYDEVVAVETSAQTEAPDGSTRDERGFAIRFADGTAWTSTGDLSLSTYSELETLLGTVSARSGVPITQVAIVE
jgi:hypothetical protein